MSSWLTHSDKISGGCARKPMNVLVQLSLQNTSNFPKFIVNLK